MNKLKIVVIIIEILYFTINTYSQDTIWLYNGEKLIQNNLKIYEEKEVITFMDEKEKINEIPLESVFSINYKNGQNKIYFTTDTFNKVSFNVEQMRSYITGEYNASLYYKDPLATVSGILVGVSSPFISTYFYGSPGIFYSPVFSSLYVTVIGLTKPKERKIKELYPQYSNDKYYILGYKEVGSQIRIRNSVIGTAIGILIGTAAQIIISKCN